MEIIGNGMMARSLYPLRREADDTVIFASGVADSACESQDEYRREIKLLYATLKKCKEEGHRIVYFSSGGAIYGNFDGAKDETSSLFPETMYGRHKLFCESVITYSGARYLILRFPNVVGRGQNRNQLIPALITQAIEGYAKIYRDARRDIIDVEDVATIVGALLQKVHDNMVLNVASGYSTPVLDIFAEIQVVLGTHAHVELVPRGSAQQFSISKFQLYLGEKIPFSPDYWRSVIRKYVSIDR